MQRIQYASFFLLFIFFNQITYSQTGWIRQNSHTNMDLEDVFFVNADTGWAVGFYGTILKTTDGGEQWNLQTRRTTAELRSIFFISPNTGWIVGENSTILYTADCGNSWIFQSIDTTNARLRDVFFINDSTGWIANFSENSVTNSLYKTTDGGTHWFPQSVPWSSDASANVLFFLDENTGWASNHGKGIAITHNGGTSWSVLEDNNDNYYYWINSICFVNDTLGWTNNSPYGVFKTTDGGNTWFKLDSQPISWGVDLYFINETTGWATGGFSDTSAVIKTLDGGDSWSIQLKYPMENIFRSIYFFDSTTGWVVGSGGAIFKTTTGGITFVDEKNINHISPYNFELSQNCPNPFNPSTNIRFNLAKSGNVRLKIYNLKGQEIVTLVNRYLITGKHEITWQPKGLPSGIYFYRLQAGDFSETKKLILQK